MAKLIQDIKPMGISSAYVDAPFDEAKEELEKNGYRVISAEQNAKLRIEKGKEAKVSTWGNYVREGVLYIPNKGAFITRGSLVMANPKEATEAHKNGKEFYVTPEQTGVVIGDTIRVPYGITKIPTNRFGENEVTSFLFAGAAQDYGDFLKEAGKKEISLYFNEEDYVHSQEKPYVNQVWLARLGNGSSVVGDGRALDYNSTVRGVFLDAEGVTPSKPLEKKYTINQITDAFKKAGLPRLESMVIESLEANN